MLYRERNIVGVYFSLACGGGWITSYQCFLVIQAFLCDVLKEYDYPFSTPAENAVNKKISANHLKFCKTAVLVVCQRDNHVIFCTSGVISFYSFFFQYPFIDKTKVSVQDAGSSILYAHTVISDLTTIHGLGFLFFNARFNSSASFFDVIYVTANVNA